jgi:hypothetical protein
VKRKSEDVFIKYTDQKILETFTFGVELQPFVGYLTTWRCDVSLKLP